MKAMGVSVLAQEMSLARFDQANAGAIEQAYTGRARQLWSYARRLGLNASAAEDVMQEAFARALATNPGAVADLDHWLFRVVHNLAVDQIRRQHRDPRPAVASDFNTPDDERLALWQLVDRLPQRQRAVLYLRYRADLDFRAIGAILGLSDSGARTLATRALDRLRQQLGEE